jgi:alpha-ribazole phosphatase
VRPTRLYLLRHGETTWNVARRYQGALDSPLSRAGRVQTLRLGETLARVPLRAVYSSPLARALETAAAIAGAHRLPVRAHDGLGEIRVGEWEGLSVSEIETRYAEAVRGWYETPHLTRIPGGETIEEMRERAVAAVDEIVRAHAGEPVAVVAHGGVNKTVLLTALGAPLSCYWRIRQGNACISVLEYGPGRPVVWAMNDTTHLRVGGPAAPPARGEHSPETW